jgi:hypothetical protein
MAPNIDLTNISVKVAMFVATEDEFTLPSDAMWTSKWIPNLIKYKEI